MVTFATSNSLDTFATLLKEDAGKLSFWGLPAEVRDNVYEKVLEDHDFILSRHSGKKKRLAINSCLIRTNKQVRSELLSVAGLRAPNIRTSARNFDFGHIVTFLNRLSHQELQALPTVNIPSKRTITIELLFTGWPYPVGLFRWVRRTGHETKKGTNIDFRYTASQVDKAHVQVSVPHWQAYLVHMPAGRAKDELTKIVQALT